MLNADGYARHENNLKLLFVSAMPTFNHDFLFSRFSDSFFHRDSGPIGEGRHRSEIPAKVNMVNKTRTHRTTSYICLRSLACSSLIKCKIFTSFFLEELKSKSLCEVYNLESSDEVQHDDDDAEGILR